MPNHATVQQASEWILAAMGVGGLVYFAVHVVQHILWLSRDRAARSLTPERPADAEA